MNKEPAFPLDKVAYHFAESGDTEGAKAYIGLTKREYFAGLAMQGILSDGGVPRSDQDKENVARHCITQADALMVELEKGENDE